MEIKPFGGNSLHYLRSDRLEPNYNRYRSKPPEPYRNFNFHNSNGLLANES